MSAFTPESRREEADAPSSVSSSGKCRERNVGDDLTHPEVRKRLKEDEPRDLARRARPARARARGRIGRPLDVRRRNGEGVPDAEERLEDEREQADNVDALVVLADVHDDLEQQSGEGDSLAHAKVAQDRDDRDDGEDDGTRVVANVPVCSVDPKGKQSGPVTFVSLRPKKGDTQ